MIRKTWALGFLTMAMGAPVAHSQTAPAGAAPPAANAVDPAKHALAMPLTSPA
jgi:hypothetical protein